MSWRPPCSARELNIHLTIEAPSSVASEGGQRRETFADLAEVWARIEPLAARERHFDESIEHVRRHRFLLRFRSDLTAAHRLRWKGRLFVITGLFDPEERQRWLLVETEEVTP